MSGGAIARLQIQLKAAKEEINSLRLALNLEKVESIDVWAQHSPQHLRDEMAANALIAEKLDEANALRRLGFILPTVEGKSHVLNPIVWDWAKQIFGTDGCKAILAMDMQDANANKAAIIASLVRKSRGDGPDSVRAAQQLSKMADWNEGDKSAAAKGATVINLMQMFGETHTNGATNGKLKIASAVHNPEEIIDADTFVVHEPTAEGAVIADTDTPEALSK